MNILYLEDDFITAEQSKNIINFYNNHSIHSYEYRTDFNNVSYYQLTLLIGDDDLNYNYMTVLGDEIIDVLVQLIPL